MATVVLHSTAGGSALTGSLDYASKSYAAANVYYLSYFARVGSGNPDTPTPTLTNGTFTALTTALFTVTNYRLCVWRLTVSTDTTAVLNIAPSFGTGHWVDSHLVECTGYTLATPEVQTKRGDQLDGVSSTFTITADSAPAAGNSMLWMSGYSGYGGSYTPGTGFTELADSALSSETAGYTQWKNTGDQVAETTAPANDGYSAGLLIELAVAAAAVPRQPVPIVGASQAAQRSSRW